MVDFLNEADDIEVVGEAATPQQGLALAESLQPDAALVDYDLGGHDGIALAEEISIKCPDCAVVILTAFEDESQMLRAIGFGAKGYLIKDIEPEQLVTQLRRIQRGDMIYPGNFLVNQVRSTLGKKDIRKSVDLANTLTPREKEVLQHVTDGLTDREVGNRLAVSENTIKNHMKSVRKKLGVNNRVQATLTGLRLGIVKKHDLPFSGKSAGPFS